MMERYTPGPLGDITSDLGQVKYHETKGIGYDVYGSHDHKVIVEYVGVITDLQIPLLTIDQRGVSIMSALFVNRRVTHLRFVDA